MKFILIDSILEQSDERIVAIKQVTLAEEYLGDHFPRFPVLPGVLMVEAMVQSARAMLTRRTNERLVLGEVRALKYGAMVRPGETLRVEVTLSKINDDGTFDCKGQGQVLRQAAIPADSKAATPIDARKSPADADAGETCVAGRFTMRPVRT